MKLGVQHVSQKSRTITNVAPTIFVPTSTSIPTCLLFKSTYCLGYAAVTPHGDSWNGPLHGLKFGFPHKILARFLVPCQVRDVSSFCVIPRQHPRIRLNFALFCAPLQSSATIRSISTPGSSNPCAVRQISPPCKRPRHFFQVHSRYASSARYILPLPTIHIITSHHDVLHRRGLFPPPRVDSQLSHNMRQPPHLPRASCHRRAESSCDQTSWPRINLSPIHPSVFFVILLRRRWSGHIYTPPIPVLGCTLFRHG